jgi:hypothetical protein
MTYGNKKKHRHLYQLKVLLNEEDSLRFLNLAESYGVQRGVLSRRIIKAVIEIIEREGALPDWIKRDQA